MEILNCDACFLTELNFTIIRNVMQKIIDHMQGCRKKFEKKFESIIAR